VLYLAIPTHNEDATIGVLLWRLRTVLAEFPREYEVVVYDDASTDDTVAVAEQYTHAMPVTVIRGTTKVGYAGAIDALVRYVAAQTRYPRRDAILLLQGDFTDPPGIVPEFARRFEGGADLVAGERNTVADGPVAVQRLFRLMRWAIRPFVTVEGLHDLTASMRLIRISALRDLLRAVGDEPVCTGDSWTANADLLLNLVPHTRRVESVLVEPTYGVRMRETRRVAVRDALAALRWAWSARGRRAAPSSAPDAAGESKGGGRVASVERAERGERSGRRREEPELSAELLREKARDRDKGKPTIEGGDATRGGRDGAYGPIGRDGRRVREPARDVSDEAPAPATAPATMRAALRDVPTNIAATRDLSTPRQAAEAPIAPDGAETAERRPRGERLPRGQRTERTEGDSARPRRTRQEPLSPYADPTIELDDPFAAPVARRSPLERLAVDGADSVPKGASAELERPDAEPTGPTGSGAGESTAPTESRNAESLDTVDPHPDPIAEPDHGPEADGEGDATSDADTPGGREKRRRRNRRSRRRRPRTRADGSIIEGEETGDEPQEELPADDRASDRESAPRRPQRSAEPEPSEEGARAAEGEEDRFEALDTEFDDQDDSAQPARRRGRRGRRGGARRSRGRQKGENGGTDSGGNDGDVAGSSEAGTD